MWLLAQLRQPGRSIFRDLTRSTFDDHLRILLNRPEFQLPERSRRTVVSSELEVRKEAYKLCRLQSIGITAAMKQVTTDNEHRTQHWVQLIAIANSSGANDTKIARLEKGAQVRSSSFPVTEDAPQAEGIPTVADVRASSSSKFFFSAEGVRT